MTTSQPFKKSVLVNELEYKRLRQKQIRDYQPDLSKLAQLQDQMFKIMNNRKLDEHEKMMMLAEPQAQFERLRSELGVLNGTVRDGGGEDGAAATTQVTVGGPGAATPRGPEGVRAAKKDTDKGDDADEVEDLRIPATSHPKAKKLFAVISRNPGVISANQDGELVVNGDAVPGSSFFELVRSLFTKRRPVGPHMVGMNELFAGLRQLNVPAETISSKPLRAMYNPNQVVTGRRGAEAGIDAGGQVLTAETPARQKMRALIQSHSGPRKKRRLRFATDGDDEADQSGYGGIFSKGHKEKSNIKYDKLRDPPLKKPKPFHLDDTGSDTELDLYVRRPEPKKVTSQKGKGGAFSKGHKENTHVKYVRIKDGGKSNPTLLDDEQEPPLDMRLQRPPPRAAPAGRQQYGRGYAPPGCRAKVLYVY